MTARVREWTDSQGKARKNWSVDIVWQGKRLRRNVPSDYAPGRAGALEFERDWLEDLRTNKSAIKSPTFKEFVEKRWLPTYPSARSLRPSSVRAIERHLRVQLQPTLDSLKLSDITAEVLQKLFAKLRDKGLSEKTLYNVRATLSAVLGTAIEWKALDKMPKLPQFKVPEAEWDWLTREESEKVIAGGHTLVEKAIMRFAFCTGARCGEIIALKWGDLDWHNEKVFLRRGRTEGHEASPKNKKGRHVPMVPSVAAAIKAIRHLKGDYVFYNPEGVLYTNRQLQGILARACLRAGVRRISPHDMRHSFASQLASAGTPLLQLKEWLGHSDIKMTMRYAHLQPGGGREWMGIFEATGT